MSVRERLISRLSDHFDNIPDALRKRRLVVGIVFLALLAASIVGIGKLRMDMTIEGWFHKEDPTLVAFHRYHEQFGSEDGVYIVYKPKDGDVFSPASLEAVRGIQEALINYRSRLKEGETSALDHIVKVDTLVNASVLTVDGDVLVSRQLVGDTVPKLPLVPHVSPGPVSPGGSPPPPPPGVVVVVTVNTVGSSVPGTAGSSDRTEVGSSS